MIISLNTYKKNKEIKSKIDIDFYSREEVENYCKEIENQIKVKKKAEERELIRAYKSMYQDWYINL